MPITQSFYWSEDFNESLNYWFWRRRLGKIEDELLVERFRHTLGLRSVEAHRELEREEGFTEYLTAWRQWKLEQINRHARESRITPAKTLKAHHAAVAALGVSPFTIQWVMTSFGQRWVLPPSMVLLGADGGTAAERRNAVLDAAKALLQT